ncbi:diguanylate cyclase [Cuneatibacter caecimuris]|uniref:PAS domain S-box-containing protein/diguanylate cyclase (GGDEF)-like protein n=1 Tax=Cuneatibacter caecimuris TaxID=1796618 RepID=A0A4Q7P2V1_9FIRM|nr:diguanylate cyclase [Cuneatibacter caecimuris]RZS94241.1 PAS domain S-box-containing protein/diguanylate cyclase (GGDEF)-like protein [Cuneatibacter caecimuris]
MKKEVRNYHGDLAAIQEIFMSMSVRFDSIYYINLVENTFFAPAQTEAAAVNYSHSGNYTDMVHTYARKIVHPLDRLLYEKGLMPEVIGKKLEGQGFEEFEYRSKVSDGSYHWFRLQIVPAKFREDGRAEMATLFTTDINENKQQELEARQLLEEQAEQLQRQARLLLEQNRELHMGAERFRIVMENSDKIVFEYDMLMGCLALIVPEKREEQINVSLDQLERGCVLWGRKIIRFRPGLKNVIKQITEGEKRTSCEMQMQIKNGEEAWQRITLAGMRDEKRNVRRIVGMMEDITLQKETEKAAAIEEKFRRAMRQECQSAYEVNFSTGDFIFCQAHGEGAALPEKGESYENFVFRLAEERVHEDSYREFIEAFSLGNIWNAFQQKKNEIHLDCEMLQQDGKMRWHNADMHLFKDQVLGDLKGYFYLIDIDNRKREELELIRKAERDSLTDVYNKGTTEREIRKRLKMSRYVRSGTLFMIDIDYFKNINDTYGHLTGDRVIRDCAAALRSLFRAEDVIGRVGGDEFCIFFDGFETENQVAVRAEAVKERVGRVLPAREGKPGSSVSIGISRNHGKRKSFEQLYQEADKALYCQKQHGKNGYSFFREGEEEN